jgi:hypothetical protein
MLRKTQRRFSSYVASTRFVLFLHNGQRITRCLKCRGQRGDSAGDSAASSRTRNQRVGKDGEVRTGTARQEDRVRVERANRTNVLVEDDRVALFLQFPSDTG